MPNCRECKYQSQNNGSCRFDGIAHYNDDAPCSQFELLGADEAGRRQEITELLEKLDKSMDELEAAIKALRQVKAIVSARSAL